ncbi:MAG: mandelate racemase/muconate lactonizing enzyme family protein [Pseudomonadota bacterium]
MTAENAIADIRTHLLSMPFADPPKTGFLTLEMIDLLVVEVELIDGTIGTGHLHPLAPGIRTIELCIHEVMKPLILGQPCEPEALWDAMWKTCFIHGRMGITVMASSALDIALWDVVGRRAGKPLWQLWGGSGDPQPVYGSGCFRGLGHDGMIEKAERFVAQGFNAIKMQVAHVFTLDEDEANVRDMRAALGDSVEIMVDVNQGWDAETAIVGGKRLDPYGLSWLEEPVLADDIDGYLAVANAIETPVVGGENHWLTYDTLGLMRSGRIPILQPDIMRGGYTGLRRQAADAASHGVKIAPHMFPELSSQITAAIPNASWLEAMGWHDHLWVEPIPVTAGTMAPPDRPGHGMDFKPELFREFPYRA